MVATAGSALPLGAECGRHEPAGAPDGPRSRYYWSAAYRSILRFRASTNSMFRRRYSR